MTCEACERRADAIRNLRERLAQARTPTCEHCAWERLIYGTPEGTEPLPVYETADGTVVVCGTPAMDDPRHDCDTMGCSSVSHVLWRGSMRAFVEAMTSAAEPHPATKEEVK